MNSFTIEIPGKPLSLNEVSGNSHWQSSAEKAIWRKAGRLLASPFQQKLTMPVDLEFTCLSKGRLTDSISPALAYKALTDSLKDARVIPDDSPTYVRRLIINRPLKANNDAIRLTVTEVDEA